MINKGKEVSIMKYAYTAVFTPEDNGQYSVDFPDLQRCYTSGDDMSDAIFMAQDVLNLTLYDLEQDKKPIPRASKPQEIKLTDEQFTSIIAVDTETYRRFYENKSVKKTLTIPMWLNERAEQANINFSGVLQSALKELLHIKEITH
jgi:predicted RNase H-like HicB family nuclease